MMSNTGEDQQQLVFFQFTDFKGKPRGNLGCMSLATDGKYLYFTWEEDFGDIWVMDVEWE